MMKVFKNYLVKNPTKTITLSFLMVILIGTCLLSLPISNQQASTGLINHFFVATSATCVTGLTPVVVAEQYTLFGQLVILAMIQIGGLGFLSFLMLFFVLAKKRLSFSSRLLMAQAINQSSLDQIDDFLAYIIKYTFSVELLGAIFLFVAFVQEYSFFEALYYSVFHAISAFCNAGFDVLGSNSLMNYSKNAYVLLVISALIILGGIGFLVAKELQEKMRMKYSIKKLWLTLSVHTKLVLTMTFTLLILGTILVFVLEHDHPSTLGNLSFFDQVVNSFFQSVTYRTAGFAAISQSDLYDASKLVACLLMFIGGSPAGCAGGIKTVTLAVLYLVIQSTLKGNEDVVVYARRISHATVRQALSVICISLMVVFIGTILLSSVESLSMIDLLYETFSAFATVGLTSNVTPYLSSVGKCIVMVLMLFGRIGPIAMVLTLMKKHHHQQLKEIRYPEGDLIIG